MNIYNLSGDEILEKLLSFIDNTVSEVKNLETQIKALGLFNNKEKKELQKKISSANNRMYDIVSQTLEDVSLNTQEDDDDEFFDIDGQDITRIKNGYASVNEMIDTCKRLIDVNYLANKALEEESAKAAEAAKWANYAKCPRCGEPIEQKYVNQFWGSRYYHATYAPNCKWADDKLKEPYTPPNAYVYRPSDDEYLGKP